ncbi:MAG: flagellar basal body rod protein FlgC [candidate division Zixibacteria bacterium]|nr:flagellar basal body rod protein FlgC [candidate division Zixibacteria bacterium]
MSGIFASFKISSSGLSAQRRRMDAIAANIANAETTTGPDGSFYKRKKVAFKEVTEPVKFANELKKASSELASTHPRHIRSYGKRVSGTSKLSFVESRGFEAGQGDFKLVYDPSHPDADDRGYVKMPDINVLGEMVDLMVASRAYEANVATLEASKNIANKALEI